MAFFFTDHIHTKSFTPREHQVELLYSALERNIIICLGKNVERTFIATKLVQELSINNRKPLANNGKRIIYLLEDKESCDAKVSHIKQSTDLQVLECNNPDDFDVETFGANAQVLVLTVEMCSQLLTSKTILPTQIKLLLIDKCHNLVKNKELCKILNTFRFCDNATRIVGFAVPLYSLTKEPGQLSFEIERIESSLQCQIETASDLLSILRYNPKPREYILAYRIPTPPQCNLADQLWSCANHMLNFLNDHRYDPSEIYHDFSDEINRMPNPTDKPRQIIREFLDILEHLGPWAADRAAFVLLLLTEKLKIKTPYDRHFLLLGTLSTMFVKIRAYCDSAFEGLKESEKIIKFSTPKILRLIEVIKVFTPTDKSESTTKPNEKADSKSEKKENNQERPVRNSYKKSEADFKRNKFVRPRGPTDPDLLCGLIFVDNIITAKVLFHLLNELSKNEDEFRFLSPLYMSEKSNDDIISGRDIELEHKKQEEVLKKFRIHECNLLISTSVLEEGIDIPKCNFVMRFDFPKGYQSYVQCKSRARAPEALHILLAPQNQSSDLVRQLAHYHCIERILLTKCSSKDASAAEELEADAYDFLMPVYKPLPALEAPKVTLNSSISLINRYCAKLPSDTFTRLTPEWKLSTVEGGSMEVCTLRLPINSPLKYTVSSYPMPSRALAKRTAALRMCVQLHRERELDEHLLPVGKENFRAHPEDGEVPALPGDEAIGALEARPGTTKRRQYYYKKIAEALVDCRPTSGHPCYLYHVRMLLSCPLPEEQNTRGRKIYPPEDSAIGFGILTRKRIPKLCPFPIYTRSGEVRVELKLCRETVLLDDQQIDKAVSFLNYTFTNVLRLQKYLMLFDPSVSENSYIIVPVKRTSSSNSDVKVDWEFIERIYASRDSTPKKPEDSDRKDFSFDASKYNDAVVMPWYRNQDQPQYFYVAEICSHLNPRSSFPGSDYRTFQEYYERKYNIQIQNLEQPLLDVDHTSARLNFLTPRYVNRKGVALPTSSEETKRAKRENLEQKQILVAELCAVHPFPASLWRQAVCLPCILYRINALLLADQIRCEVARAIGLGCENLSEDFEWPALDFGWSLADVLKKSRESDKTKSENKENKSNKDNKDKASKENDDEKTKESKENNNSVESDESQESIEEKKSSQTKNNGEDSNVDELEIGTWSNDMCNDLPVVDNNFDQWRYGSPTYGSECSDDEDDYAQSAGSYSDDDDDDNEEASSDGEKKDGFTTVYNNDNEAEAFDLKGQEYEKDRRLGIDAQDRINNQSWDSLDVEDDPEYQQHRMSHQDNVQSNIERIMTEGLFVPADSPVTFGRRSSKVKDAAEVKLEHEAYVREVAEVLKKEIKEPSTLKNVQVPATISELRLPLAEDNFSFDHQPNLEGHPGPSPSLILQALTMSNANDGINLERLETIGDSFLKYAITTYLFCTYNNIHEGKLSHLRSKQVSNLNLYRLGRRKCLGESMIATKFEPHDNWLPPCYKVPKELEQALIESGIPSAMWSKAELEQQQQQHHTEVDALVRETEQKLETMRIELAQQEDSTSLSSKSEQRMQQESRSFIPYNLITQHSIPDKSIADCVEALIGAYLIACGPRGALLFMSWLGIHVLPTEEVSLAVSPSDEERVPGSTPYLRSEEEANAKWTQLRYGALQEPPSPLFHNVAQPEEELALMLDGYDALESSIGYPFANRSYLLQAFTHASYQPNRLTDCYQRLEFLGDAVLDYLITRHLYEDPRQHSPGALTDLRSALVNNTIFASLAVRCGFHKYFRHLSPGLNAVIDRFVRIQEENGHAISEEYYLLGEPELAETKEAEDVEVPKALGDVFESLAGAIYLDSGMSLDAVWSVYYKIMRAEIEQFSANVPKSPIRELLELEPETAKFGRPEKLADGKRVRVTVDVFGKGSFKGIGRNYRIAKCTAAKCALKKLKKAKRTT